MKGSAPCCPGRPQILKSDRQIKVFRILIGRKIKPRITDANKCFVPEKVGPASNLQMASIQPHDLNRIPGLGRRRVGFADHQAVGRRQPREH